jgi:hypothetical protein
MCFTSNLRNCVRLLQINCNALFTDDHSRVRLVRNSIDYINASLVVVPEADRSYILTQVSWHLIIAYK